VRLPVVLNSNPCGPRLCCVVPAIAPVSEMYTVLGQPATAGAIAIPFGCTMSSLMTETAPVAGVKR